MPISLRGQIYPWKVSDEYCIVRGKNFLLADVKMTHTTGVNLSGLNNREKRTGDKMSDKKKTFEQSLEELEKIVSKLENGELNLDESLKNFEVATKLYKECKTELSRAEKKISVLTESLQEEDYKV